MFWFSKETERYKVIDSPVEVDFYDKPLYRILALKNGLHCKKGEFGGLVESKENLSTIGDSWIDYRSAVYNGGVVFGEALVLSSKIDGGSVYESANVMSSVVKNFARVGGCVDILRSTIEGDYVEIGGKVFINNSIINGTASINNSASFVGAHICSDKDWVSIDSLCGNNLNGSTVAYRGKNGEVLINNFDFHCLTPEQLRARLEGNPNKEEWELFLKIVERRLP